jgi:hypothetical protein
VFENCGIVELCGNWRRKFLGSLGIIMVLLIIPRYFMNSYFSVLGHSSTEERYVQLHHQNSMSN